MKNMLLEKWYRSNADIKDYVSQTAHLQTPRTRRTAVNIAVIDDEPFAPQTNLQSYGYNVTPIGDLKALGEVANYHMILCDIMGVGRHFDTKMQGASLISEIKKTYPEKIVIAYTGAGLNEKAARLATERADKILKKDIDIEEWIFELDLLSQQAIDPHVIWGKVRSRFVELGVDTKHILVLEDAYVRSVLGKDRSFTGLTAALGHIKPSQDVRAIVQGLASSLIFGAIFGNP